MLSSLPKLLDKNFVIGFYLPALLALFTVAWTFQSLEILEPLRNVAGSEKNFSDLTYIALVVWVLAVLLLTTNNFQYRLLEGYLPPTSWCAPLAWWQRHCFSRLRTEVDTLENEWQKKGKGFSKSRLRRLARLQLDLLSRFPTSIDELLPTRFGNAIKAFEVYPRQVYGADSIPVWLRLASVISKEFASQIDDARTRVDCFVNITCLATLISFSALGTALLQANWMIRSDDAFFWGRYGAHQFHFALVGFVIAILAYRWAAIQVVAWGDLVKSAFDCYLPALIKQLGYAVPAQASDRHAFWVDFNRMVLYQQQMTREWPIMAPDKPKQSPPSSTGQFDTGGDNDENN